MIFIAGYLPGYKSGGPLVSVANMVEAFGDEINFRIVAMDRDLKSSERYDVAVTEAWVQVGKAKVRYLGPEELKLKNIARILREEYYDTLYLNSYFNPSFSILPLIALKLGLAPRARVILATRGEFSTGALRIKSFKKRCFMLLSKLVCLHRNIVWQASSIFEKEDTERVLPLIARDIRVAKDLPGTARQGKPRTARGAGEPLRVVYLSRISPMKNLMMALNVLGSISAPISFTIAGPREDIAYWEDCARMIEDLPANISISIVEGVPASRVRDFLSEYDLFFLPTQGENYGHVIAEALDVGLRVLISDRTPWRNLAEAGIGYDLPLEDIESFRRALLVEAHALPDEPAITTRKTRAYLEFNLQRERVRADNYALLTSR